MGRLVWRRKVVCRRGSTSAEVFSRPRVFVSHRKDDYKEAKDVVEEAERSGFDYWLDVEDPILNAIGNLPGPQHSIACLGDRGGPIEL